MGSESAAIRLSWLGNRGQEGKRDTPRMTGPGVVCLGGKTKKNMFDYHNYKHRHEE